MEAQTEQAKKKKVQKSCRVEVDFTARFPEMETCRDAHKKKWYENFSRLAKNLASTQKPAKHEKAMYLKEQAAHKQVSGISVA